ncbi:MAG TPA: hypothetical protein VE907_16980 [Gammaproteobacteria bacterium]|nr:hypothetical protein [Gammaproteobacteria bacterium]
MKTVDERWFLALATPASDHSTSFEELWREADERGDAGADPDDCSKVRLPCSGELVHVGSIVLVGVRAFPRGGELLEFTCPRCDQRHESHLFR